MRKINLSVQSPCHENWDQMQPAEQGKFCASCCKTVTDFTGMSDRQLAEFFKKPKENLCGRFYTDQLERDILIPKKRIPWMRYFFQFTWPAFVLLLKSCGPQTRTKGKMLVKTEQTVESYPIILGEMVDQVQTVPVPEIKTVEALPIEMKGEITMGIIPLREENLVELKDTIPTLMNLQTDAEDTIVIAENDMDTVVICSNPDYDSRTVIMGGIGRRGISIQSNETAKEMEVKPAPVPRIFPNPANAGSLITIVYKNGETLPDIIQIFTVTGQLVRQERISISKDATVFNLNLPESLKPGMYLIKFTDSKNNTHHTEKLVIQ